MLTISVTILAFVYVPINLATSIYGMNLQQLNHTGQNAWSFILTVLVSLFVTGLLWFSLVQYNSVIDWNRKNSERVLGDRDRRPRLPIAVRVALFFGLVYDDE